MNLYSIKESIQTVLANANTTTASPVDLSANLWGADTETSRRVQTIRKVNPDKIPTQANLFPFVTVFVEGKEISQRTIAGSQAQGKRMAEVDFKVMGVVFNDNLVNQDEDPADNDIEYLMENIEHICRSNPTFGNSLVITSMTESVEYYRGQLIENQNTHVRAGVLTLRVKTDY